VRRTCCEEVGDDREIPPSSFGASPAFCGVVTPPPRACPCSAGLLSCAPACAGAPPGCLCRLVPERDGGPSPSSSNVCVCSTDLPRGRSPETWGSPPRSPRLAVHFVARKLRAIMSITSSSFSCIELVLTTSSSLNSLRPCWHRRSLFHTHIAKVSNDSFPLQVSFGVLTTIYIIVNAGHLG
jgi:hypothetical protein